MRTLHTLSIALLTALASPLLAPNPLPRPRSRSFSAEDAFKLEASANAGGIYLTWTVAEGYYAYRKRLLVKPEGSTAVTLGDMVAPKGKLKEDQFFGTVETYRGSVPLAVPVVQGEGSTVIAATIQGCADAGLCYPPHTERVTLDLTPTVGATKVSLDSTSVTAQVAQTSDGESASRVNALSKALGIAPTLKQAVPSAAAEADGPNEPSAWGSWLTR